MFYSVHAITFISWPRCIMVHSNPLCTSGTKQTLLCYDSSKFTTLIAFVLLVSDTIKGFKWKMSEPFSVPVVNHRVTVAHPGGKC